MIMILYNDIIIVIKMLLDRVDSIRILLIFLKFDNPVPRYTDIDFMLLSVTRLNAQSALLDIIVLHSVFPSRSIVARSITSPNEIAIDGSLITYTFSIESLRDHCAQRYIVIERSITLKSVAEPWRNWRCWLTWSPSRITRLNHWVITAFRTFGYWSEATIWHLI